MINVRRHRRMSSPSRRAILTVGLVTMLAGGFLGAGTALAGTVSPDDTRASVTNGNFNNNNLSPCPDTLVYEGDANGTTQNGITVTHNWGPITDNFLLPAFGTALTSSNDYLTVTLPAGDTLTGHIDVMGGDGWNSYSGSASTLLIPPANNGNQIATISHYRICGTLNTPKTATVHVTKEVTGSAAPASSTVYDINVTCAGATTTLHLTGGTSGDVTGIADGAACTVAETTSHGATSTTYTLNGASSNGSFNANANGPNNVVVTNDFQPAPPPPGSVHVTKQVTGTPPSGLGQFDIQVDCGGTTTDLSLGAGDSGDVNNVAAGTHCTVTEPDNKGASSTTFTVGGGSAQGTAAFDITSGQTTDVTVTNFYQAPTEDPASLTVTKSVTGVNPPSGPFTIDADCGSAGVYIFQISAPGTHTINNLPAGTVCAVSETDSDGATSTTYQLNGSPTTAPATTPALAAGGSATVAITNDYEPNATPSLTISKSAVPASGSFVHRGDRIDYTLSYANTGTADATDVSVVDTLPADVTFIQSSAPAAVFDSVARTLTWQLGTVAAGGSGTLNYSVTVDQTATNGERLPNIAVIETPSSTTPSNPTVHTVVVPTGALSIVKAVDKTNAKYGDDLTYTLQVGASGDITQHNVTVTDKVPAHTTYVSSDCASPCTSAGANNGVVTWHVGDLAPGSSADLTMVVHITKPASKNGALPVETIRNVAVATSRETPHAPSNKVITRITAVLPFHIKRTHHHHTVVLPLHQTRSGQPSTLPFTGNPTRQLTGIAVGLLGAGLLLMVCAARRPRRNGDA